MAYPNDHNLSGIYQSTGYYHGAAQTQHTSPQTPFTSGWTNVQIPRHLHATGYDSTGPTQLLGNSTIPTTCTSSPMNFSATSNTNIYTTSPLATQQISSEPPPAPAQASYFTLQRTAASHGNVGTSNLIGRARAAQIRSQKYRGNQG
jgi:hypothetical protein